MKKIITFLLILFLLFSLGCVEERTYQTPIESLTPTSAITSIPFPTATVLSPTPSATPSSVTPGSKPTPSPTITTTPLKKGNLSAHFIDVGQGDSVLIQFDGKSILIDGGEKEMGSRVSSYLRNQGIAEIDLMVATHPHSDHIGGLITILNDSAR